MGRPRKPPFFTIRTSMMNDGDYVLVWADSELLALYVRLGVAAIERFADKTADAFILHEPELIAATAKKRSDSARKLLDKLVSSCPVSYQYWEGSFVVHLPKLSERQFKRSPIGTAPGPPASASSSASASIEKELPIRTLKELFQEVQEARDLYLPKTPRLKLSEKRKVQIATVRRDLGDEAHVDLLHGYVAFHLSGLADLAAGRGSGYDAMKFLVPETFWNSGRGKYADADAAALAAGMTRPYTIEQIVTGPKDPVAAIMTRRRASG